MYSRWGFILTEFWIGISNIGRFNYVRRHLWRRDHRVLALNKWIFEVIDSIFDDSSRHVDQNA